MTRQKNQAEVMANQKFTNNNKNNIISYKIIQIKNNKKQTRLNTTVTNEGRVG